MTEAQINYLRTKALRLREVAATMSDDIAPRLLELADEFELKADEIEAAMRSRTTC